MCSVQHAGWYARGWGAPARSPARQGPSPSAGKPAAAAARVAVQQRTSAATKHAMRRILARSSAALSSAGGAGSSSGARHAAQAGFGAVDASELGGPKGAVGAGANAAPANCGAAPVCTDGATHRTSTVTQAGTAESAGCARSMPQSQQCPSAGAISLPPGAQPLRCAPHAESRAPARPHAPPLARGWRSVRAGLRSAESARARGTGERVRAPGRRRRTHATSLLQRRAQPAACSRLPRRAWAAERRGACAAVPLRAMTWRHCLLAFIPATRVLPGAAITRTRLLRVSRATCARRRARTRPARGASF